MSFKAILIGIIITTVIFLSGQLAYVLLASYIGNAATEQGFISDNKEQLWFVLSAVTYAISFTLGGLFTTLLTHKKKIMHASIVGFSVAILFMLSAGDLSILNFKAVILVAVGFVFSTIGGVIGSGEPEDAEAKADIPDSPQMIK